jgi:hypothetical protein
MKRAIALALLAAMFATSARSDGISLKGFISDGVTGGISTRSSASAPPVSGALLLEDGVSILLLEDGSSSLCLEGGC